MEIETSNNNIKQTRELITKRKVRNEQEIYVASPPQTSHSPLTSSKRARPSPLLTEHKINTPTTIHTQKNYQRIMTSGQETSSNLLPHIHLNVVEGDIPNGTSNKQMNIDLIRKDNSHVTNSHNVKPKQALDVPKQQFETLVKGIREDSNKSGSTQTALLPKHFSCSSIPDPPLKMISSQSSLIQNQNQSNLPGPNQQIAFQNSSRRESFVKSKRIGCSPCDKTNSDNNVFIHKNVPISKSAIMDILPPQKFFDALLKKHGYPAKTFPALSTFYYKKPTSFQKASYGVAITRSARKGEFQKLLQIIQCGLSLNPCNQFGESLVHLLCRRGKITNKVGSPPIPDASFQTLKKLCELGCHIQICDDFGRTPLHDACWTVEPCFDTISLILDIDVKLLKITDRRGSTPLQYVRKEKWRDWNVFLLKKSQEWEGIDFGDPELLQTESVEVNENLLSTDLIVTLAAGRIDPSVVAKMSPDERRAYQASEENRLPGVIGAVTLPPKM